MQILRKPSWLAILSVVSGPTMAADNSTLPVAGGGTEVFANKDIGGVKFPKTIHYDSTGVEIFTAAAAGYVRFPSTQLVTAAGAVASAAADSGNPIKVGCKYNSTPPTFTNGNRADCQVDANGYLKVAIASGGGSGGTSSDFGSAFPTPGTAAGFTNGTNMTAARVGDVNNVAAATNYLDVLAVGRYNATPPTLTDTRFSALQLDVNGNLQVKVANVNPNGRAAAADSSPVVVAYPGALVAGSTAAMTATTSTQVIAADGALRIYVTACTFGNSDPADGTMILLQDGSGGATLWQAPAAAVFGGAHVVFPTPIRTTAATALYAVNVTTGANTFVSCTGYTGA